MNTGRKESRAASGDSAGSRKVTGKCLGGGTDIGKFENAIR